MGAICLAGTAYDFIFVRASTDEGLTRHKDERMGNGHAINDVDTTEATPLLPTHSKVKSTKPGMKLIIAYKLQSFTSIIA